MLRFCRSVFSTGVSIAKSLTLELFLRLAGSFVKVASTEYGRESEKVLPSRDQLLTLTDGRLLANQC